MSDTIHNKLREKILNGSYSTGAILKEKDLAEEFGVSRTPVRESLARLEWERLVTIIPRAGALVAPIEIALVKEAYKVRYVLDGQLGREAAKRVTAQQIADMKELREECAGLVASGSQSELNSVTRRFRGVLGEACGNRILAELTEQLFNVSVRVWQGLHDPDSHSELANALLSEMDSTIAAMSARDPDDAEKIMQDAIDYYTARLREMF
ncbi:MULTISPECIES: GntR family transcriptional regulator [unclassified Dinoroseobacter]|uniref:GntR family transcriptional regulator n=1 Tax=unclassified Dinoroseobacter TaxID=2620028 RepID=UPI003C7EC31E